MMRSTLLFFALAAVAYLSAQTFPFDRYYGQPESWSDEFAHHLEKWGDRHVVIATVERGEFLREDIVIYDFDPVTGNFTDSLTLYAIPRPEILATATTATGNLFIAIRSRHTDLIRIDQYGPDGTLQWQIALDRPAGVQLDLLALTTNNSFLLALRHPAYTEFVEVSTIFGILWNQPLAGSFTTTAAIYLPDIERWAIAGQQFPNAPFVALVSSQGALIWKTDLYQAQSTVDPWIYSYVSALTYQPATGIIQAYGGTTTGERTVATLNPLGQRIAEVRWAVPAHGFDEQLVFLPDSLLLSSGAAGYSLVDLKGASPVVLGQGTGFPTHRDLMATENGSFFQLSADRSRPFDYQLRVRFVAPLTGVLWDRTYGRAGYNPVETIRAAAVEPGGQFFYFFGAAPSPTDPYALKVFQTNNSGAVLWEQYLTGPAGESLQAWDLRWSADGNLLLLYGGLNDLYLAKLKPDGTQLWRRTLSREYQPLTEHFLLELADGSLLINDVAREAEIETVVLKRLSNTGTLLERMPVPGFERGRLRTITLVENNHILLGGVDGETFWGGRLTKFDLTTRSVPWTLALQPPGAHYAAFTAALPLNDGDTYAVALPYLHGTADRSGVQYLRIERDGAVLDWHFFETNGVLYNTNARLQVDEGNNVILSYNYAELEPVSQQAAHALRLTKFSPGLGTIYYESVRPSPYGAIDIPAAIYLGNGLSLFAGTSTGPNSYSPDMYVSVSNTGVVTGVDDPVAAPTLLIGPNPTDGRFWIETTAPTTTDQPLELIDGQGRIVHRLILPAGAGVRQSMDMSSLPQGPYFLRYRNERGGVEVVRLLKV